ncbi:hypothetical protein BH09VER1_BH09VER1_44200 [soil metagenome]
MTTTNPSFLTHAIELRGAVNLGSLSPFASFASFA